MSKLPIENYPKLLQEYGRTLAWISMAEEYLNLYILVKTGLIKADAKTTTQILDEMMIGKKISIVEDILDKKMISKLWKLNKRRILLAHGVTGEYVNMNEPTIRTGDIRITHKGDELELNEDFLLETIEQAKNLSEELRKKIIKK